MAPLFLVKILYYTTEDIHPYKGILSIYLCWSLSDPDLIRYILFYFILF